MCHNFNTSHVNVNHLIIVVKGGDIKISIHLMLMLIVVCEQRTHTIKSISIHLMLMLIRELFKEYPDGNYFNTSHVNVNPI